jgi:superfamily II DNA or RNA helicase
VAGGIKIRIKISNEITIESPTLAILEYCNRELVISNPDYFKKIRMGFWLGNTPEKLHMYRRNGKAVIVPYGVWNDIKDLIPSDTEIIKELANNPPINYRGKVPLYDYQEEAVNIVKKEKCGILQAPCGSGKTQMGVSIAIDLNKKTLWLTHTKDLLMQSYERAAQYIDKKLLGTITGGKVNIGEGITFATVQTMAKLDLTLYKYVWDVVIIDECHRLAGTPNSVTMFSKVINNLAAPYKYGLSATVHRGDGLIKSTFSFIGKVIHIVPESAVSDRTIGVTIQRVNTGIRITDECLETDGTINYPALINYLVENQERSNFIAKILVENKEHSNFIMSDRLQHLKNIMQCLVDMGIPESKIRMIDGKTKKAIREQALEDMRTGEANFIFSSFGLGKEGLDIPRLDRLYLALPKKDYTIVMQSIGRICRTAECKSSAICYDFVDQIGYCEGAWKKRKPTYKKKGCEIKEDAAPVPKKQNTLFDYPMEVLTS